MASTISAGTTTTTALSYSADTSGVLQLQTNGTTTAVTIDTSQRVLIGTTSGSYGLVVGTGATDLRAQINGSTQYQLQLVNGSNSGFWIGSPSADAMSFSRGDGVERARFDSSGNLLVGTTTASFSCHQINKGSTGGQTVLVVAAGSTGIGFFANNCDQNNYSATSCAFGGGRASNTGRSINVGGTVNASGADYAEYMVKAGAFEIAKGDICGIDANGKLTNVFTDSISFVVKSTDPSYVGGDSWGIDLEGDELESARQTVDRIAFSGQVPVNVLGSIAGQYIIPINDNGLIKGQAVSNPTFEQYQIAVGKVIAIEKDGRAKIIVKVA